MQVVTAPDPGRGPVKVSVVVATYNTGDALDEMVASVRTQSIGLDSLELVLVDDGSTDGTGERVEGLAAVEPWVVARRIPNSGWPSRPRNVGLTLARGEFVLIMDHDDELFPEALGRMAAAAGRDAADVVVGKEVRSGARTMGLDTFRRNVSGTRVIEDDLLSMLTPHRMFRRSFLEEHHIMFSERIRRLEDHELIARTFVHDPSVTVVADYPCYRWIIHDSNNSLRLPDPDDYYGALRLVLDSVDRWPHGEETRERGRATWLRATVLDRFGPGGFRTWPQEYRPRFFDAARAVTLERLPERLDALLPAAYRVRAALLRAGDMEGLLDYVAVDGTVTTAPRLTAHRLAGSRLELVVETSLAGSAGPVRFRREGERLRQLPTGPLDATVADAVLDVTEDLSAARVDVLLTERSTHAEWFLPTTATCEPVDDGEGALALRIRATATLDPATALLGRPLTEGVWDLRLRSLVLGYDSRATIRVEQGPVPPATDVGELRVKPYRTRGGRLALEVTADAGAGSAGEPVRPAGASRSSRRTSENYASGRRVSPGSQPP